MSITDDILSIVASEQQSLASILSAEAVKASQTASWLTLISASFISALPPETIVGKIVLIEKSVANVLDSAADKEIAIAAKVNAVKGNCVKVNWKPQGCGNDC